MVTLGTTGVVAAERAGGTGPVTLVTPMARPLAVALALGAVGLRIAGAPRKRDASAVPTSVGREPRAIPTHSGQLKGARPRPILVVIVGAYATLGAVPWRTIPAARGVTPADADLGTPNILSANVHSSNADHASLLSLIERERPDVVL